MRRKNKHIVLENVRLEDYAAEGKSLARVDGKVIFVANTVPGDLVDVKLSKNKKDWAEGFALTFKEYSADRVQPFCSHFGSCGGCQWQMLPYEKQLQFKHKQVVDNLTRIGKIALPEIRPILGALETTGYRNKIEYTFSNRKYLTKEEISDVTISSGENVAGFHARTLFDKVVDIDTCYLQQEPTNRIRKAVKKWAIDADMPFYDIRQHQGWIRTMQIRLCTTGELMVNVVFGYEESEKQEALLAYLVKEFPEITTLLYTVNTKMNDSFFGLEPRVYYGKGYALEKLGNFQFKVGPLSFFQTNTKQAERLYAVTEEFAGLTGNETVYDLYCGTGSIGMFLSRGAKKIIGVEMVEEAINDARENAALNNIGHTTFFAGDVSEICTPDFFAEHGKPDVIITDPPRAGMSEKLVNSILQMQAPVVVYVSCNPATQARDLALLDAQYMVTAVQPVDMFPHTLHIENVVQLKRRN